MGLRKAVQAQGAPIVRSGWEALDTARRRVEHAGLAIAPRPDGDVPALPDDLTEVDEKSLIVLMRQYTAWYDYAASLLSVAEVEEAEAKADLGRIEMVALLRGEEKTVTKAKARRAGDPEVVSASLEARKAYAYRKLVGGIADGIERKIALVSRELTRRTSMEPTRRREQRWGGG